MNRDPDGCWSRDEARSREFELTGRNQASACQLHSTLGEFLRRSHISRIFLRASSGGGPYRAKAESHMCATLLYLRGGVVIHDVSPISLASWMREQGWDFDGQARHRGWDFAAAAAIYAAEQQRRSCAAVRVGG
jgi:hypothetical protein